MYLTGNSKRHNLFSIFKTLIWEKKWKFVLTFWRKLFRSQSRPTSVQRKIQIYTYETLMDADACFCQAEAAEGSQDHLVSLHPLTILKDQSHMSKVLLTQVTKMYISGHSWEQSAQKDVWSHLIQFCRGIRPLLNAKPPHYILPFCRFLGRCA